MNIHPSSYQDQIRSFSPPSPAQINASRKPDAIPKTNTLEDGTKQDMSELGQAQF